MNSTLKTTLIVIITLIIQLIFNDYLNLGLYVSLSVIPLIVLLLPYNVYTFTTIFIAFGVGLTVDFLGNGVLGLFSGSLTMAALFRQLFLRLVSDKQCWESDLTPLPSEIGYPKFVLYISLFYLLFFITYVFLENMGFGITINSIFKIVVSTIVNIPIALILTLIYQKSRK